MTTGSIAGRAVRVLLLTLVISSAGLLGPATSAATPIDDGEHRVETAPTVRTFFSAPESCPTFPALSGLTPDLIRTIAGWYGPLGDDGVTFRVRLKAHVIGTVTDPSGNVYRVQGLFSENGERNSLLDFQVLFRGQGTLTITGRAGTYSGLGTAVTLGGPVETQLTFRRMTECHTLEAQ
jgi:hypothetical protein